MPIVATTLATEPRQDGQRIPLWERTLRAVLPQANPELEAIFPMVRLWWVEVDEQGVPQREVGFGESRSVVCIGPLQGNYGFWTDSPVVLNPTEYEAVPQEAFDRAYAQFEAEWLATAGAAKGA